MIVARQCYIEHGADLNAVDLRSLIPAYLPASEVECDVEALDRWVEVVHATYKRLFPSGDPSPPSSYGVRLDIVRYAKTRWKIYAYLRIFYVHIGVLFKVVYRGNNYFMRTFYKLPNILEITTWKYLPSEDAHIFYFRTFLKLLHGNIFQAKMGCHFATFLGVSQFQCRVLGHQWFALIINTY